MKIVFLDRDEFGGAQSRSVGAVVAINILLAVLALLKDIFIASYLGTSSGADAFSLAFFISDMIGNNLVAVAVGMNCIPLFTRQMQKEDAPSVFVSFLLINFFTAVLSALLTFTLWNFRTPVVSLLGNGFSGETKEACVRLFNIMLPTVILYPAASIGSSLLQARGRFVVSSLSPVLFNAVLLLATAACYFLGIPIEKGVTLVSAFVLIAEVSVTFYTYLFVLVGREGFRPIRLKRVFAEMANPEKLGESFRVLSASSGYLVILLLSQAALYVERYLASGFGVGSVAALNYAYRISQFPIWVFAAAISMVAFPEMSRTVESAPERAKKLAGNCILSVFLLNLPVLAAFTILRVPVTSFLFQRNNFNAESVRMTASILSGYALAIPGQSICSIMLRFIVASNKIKRAVLLYFISMSVNIAGDFLFTHFWGLAGIGYGTALMSLICAVGMMVVSGSAGVLKEVSPLLVRIIAANAAVAALCLPLNRIWDLFVVGSAFGVKCLFVLIGVVVCLSVYAAMLKILKIFR